MKEIPIQSNPKEIQPNPGKILAVHFKLHGGDGVSLQSQLLHQAIEQAGGDVHECCEDLPPGAKGLLLPELSYQSQGAKQLYKDIYMQPAGVKESELLTRLQNQAETIRRGVEKYINRHNIKALHVHNIFSLPYNPAATLAFYELARFRPDVQFIAEHHDFVFEGRQNIFPTPKWPKIAQLIEEATVPELPNIKHVTINSLAAAHLKREKNIDSTVIPDGFDFDFSNGKNHDRERFREAAGIGPNDLVVGVMTRFVPRKALEFAAELVHQLNINRSKLENAPDGIGPKKRKFGKHNSIILVLPQHEDKKDNGHYIEQIKAYAKQLRVKIIEGEDLVNSDIHVNRRKSDQIPFYEIYKELDVLCYPTTQEGFGNQLLEAIVLAPDIVPVVFEYPVFASDIAPHVPHIISLGNTYEANPHNPALKSLPGDALARATEQTILYLQNPDLAKIHAEENFQSAKREYDIHTLAQKVVDMVSDTNSTTQGEINQRTLDPIPA